MRDHWSIPTIARQSCSPAPLSLPPHHPLGLVIPRLQHIAEVPEIIELADVLCTRRKRGIHVKSTESIQLIGVQRETKLITHDDIVSEIVRVGIVSSAWMHLLLSKRFPRQRERRELREIEGGGDYYLPSQMREKRGRANGGSGGGSRDK